MTADLERFLAGKPVAAPQFHFRLDEREIMAARRCDSDGAHSVHGLALPIHVLWERGDDVEHHRLGKDLFSTSQSALELLAFYAVPLVIGTLLGGAGLWSLLTRQSAEWFRFAAQIHQEHGLFRKQLQ